MKHKIEIFDSTLREGAQTPYVSFSLNEKKKILHELFLSNIHFAEVGCPASSDIELKEIIKLSKLKERPILSVLGRCYKNDIISCSQSGVEIINIDLGISSYQLEVMRMTLEDAYLRAIEVMKIAKNTNKRIKFAAMDVFRTPFKELLKLYKIASKTGAEWFKLCDTVGIADPEYVTNIVTKLKEYSGCKLSVHFHNDFDLATANGVSAAKAGVEQIEVTLNGIGDRAGITPLVPITTYLQEIEGYPLSIDLPRIIKLSKYVSKITSIKISPIDPIVGEYCFKHSPGIHGAGVINNPFSFEPINPNKVGQTRELVLGHYTGRNVVNKFYKDIGINLDKKQLVAITNKIKLLSRIKKKISKDDLINIYNECIEI